MISDYSSFSDGDLLKELETWKEINPVITKNVRTEINKRNAVKVKKPSKKVNFDFNNDGKVDNKDASIAGKFLASRRKNKNKKN